MTTPTTRTLAATAVEIIVSINSTADAYTEVDAQIADTDLLLAHMNSGSMDDTTRLRATRTLRQLKSGQRRYRA